MPKQKTRRQMRGEDIAGRRSTGAAQFGSMQCRLDDAEQVEDADDETSVVSLNRPMKVLTMPGSTIFSACGRTISRIICQ